MVLKSARVLDLEVVIPRREVLRYLGYPRSKKPSPHVAERIEALAPTAEALVRGRGAFLIADRAQAEAVGMPRPSDLVAFGVCTVGPELELEEVRLGDRGDPLGALILDAFGSAAAEQAADVLHASICAAVQDDAFRAALRVSPGYGTWNVIRQRDLLARLPVDEVGVRLNEACMMWPRKSVSFAVAIRPADEVAGKGHCAACEMADCRYRRNETETR